MKRRWTYVLHTRPPEAVVPTLCEDDLTVLVCPVCGHGVTTPVGWNPWSGTDERMILVPNRPAACPHAGCGAMHWILPDVARRHNEALYPDNPEVWRQRPNAEEEN